MPNAWVVNPTIGICAFAILILVFIFFIVKNGKERILARNEKDKAIQEKEIAELNLLKAQLNSHFLFNTLNNLYVLALEKSDQTPEVISKISSLFHYILYECNEREVKLEREIKLIKNYIDLEKLRYDERLVVDFKYPNKINAAVVAPMLLFTLVENSFKHGSSKDTEQPWIKMNISLTRKEIIFDIQNSKPKIKEEKQHGVGLINLKKRLDLIYPNRYELNIQDYPIHFHVLLKITRILNDSTKKREK